MVEEYFEAVEAQREYKDQYFSSDPGAPLPPEQQNEFPGLDYFEADLDYRFELEVHEHEDPETITVETSTDGEREYLEWGEFRFTVDGEEVTLQAYKSEPDDDRLWVPFRDETCGEETYSAGRYLDLDEEEHRTPAGKWILDFNIAYNPTCAYNAAFECPLIPTANWLDVRIEAGEKDYPGETADPVVR